MNMQEIFIMKKMIFNIMLYIYVSHCGSLAAFDKPTLGDFSEMKLIEVGRNGIFLPGIIYRLPLSSWP